MDNRDFALHPYALLLSLLLAARSFRKGSLQASGAVGALVIGYATMACPTKIFGCCLIVFFLAGSTATKYKHDLKARLVDESSPAKKGAPVAALTVPEGRDWRQVLCNSLFGTACAVAWRTLAFRTGSGPVTCIVSQAGNEGWSRALLWGAVAFWGGCAGDTFASELGLLSKSKPRLVTNFKVVPAGVNGAISPLGTFLSFVGGVLVGVAALSTLLLEANRCSLVECLALPAIGGVAGLTGSMLDSLLGAVAQETRFSKKEQRVVPAGTALGGVRDVVVIAGKDLLSNNQVNILSSTAAGLLGVAASLTI